MKKPPQFIISRTYWTRARSRKAAAANIRAQHPGIPAWKVSP